MQVKNAEHTFIMDQPTFRSLRCVIMDTGGRYNAGQLPRELFEDIQRVIVWMDNADH